MRYHIVIEGTDRDQMEEFWNEIQNEYDLFDNCVFEEVDDEDSIIEDEDRCMETGELTCKRPKQSPNEPKEE